MKKISSKIKWKIICSKIYCSICLKNRYKNNSSNSSRSHYWTEGKTFQKSYIWYIMNGLLDPEIWYVKVRKLLCYVTFGGEVQG